MARIKFYRGDQNTSLPNQLLDGAIYILDKGNGFGEIWADLGTEDDPNSLHRIKLNNDNNVIVKTKEEWFAENPRTTSEPGKIYVFSNQWSYTETYEEDGETKTREKPFPGIKVSSTTGNYVVDLPWTNIDPAQIEYWNDKVTCYEEEIVAGEEYRIVFTKENIAI